MARKDLVAVYGRLVLVVAAFAFVAAIIGGPLLQKIWSSPVVKAEQSEGPALRTPKPLSETAPEKQG